MIISCNSCGKKFVVPDKAISESGRLVQCSACGNKWTQFPIGKKTKTTEKNTTSNATHTFTLLLGCWLLYSSPSSTITISQRVAKFKSFWKDIIIGIHDAILFPFGSRESSSWCWKNRIKDDQKKSHQSINTSWWWQHYANKMIICCMFGISCLVRLL